MKFWRCSGASGSGVFWLGLVLLLAGAPSSHAAAPEASLRRLIDWMPDDTETLALARGSLVLLKQVGDGGMAAFLSPQARPKGVFWGSAALPADYVIRCAPGQTVRLAMEARRNFRPPADLGLMRYEGCALFQLAPTAATTQARLTTNILKGAKSRIRIGATDVGVYAERSNLDDWTYYVCAPAPNLVLVATDRAFLEEVLSRRASQVRAKSVLLPATWKGWANVNTAAPFWAVRRLGPRFGFLLVSEPDPTAQFLTVSLSGQQLVWRYGGKKGTVAGKMAEILGRETRLPVKAALLAGGLSEVRVDLRKADHNQIGYLSFFLLGFMGPAIFV